jgi:class 3 adenylate cyclase
MMEEPLPGYAIDRACPKCRAPADPSHRFCGRCGTALPIVCSGCFTMVAPGSEFCTYCGDALQMDSRGARPAVREERRVVSVLFVDLAGFTSVAERLDPEDLRRLQVSYFATASAVIRRYQGIVEKYIGDAVMAVFGVPVQTELDALRAVTAGLELQRALDGRLLAGRYRMRASVGVATGEALVDLAAARHGGEVLASGDVVATAARLQQNAPKGSVLVDMPTRRATIGSIRYAERSESISLAGKSAPMNVWVARETARVRLDDEVEDTPLVGRAHELDVLNAALVHCVASRQAQLVSLVGPHGLGKSRLVRELFRRVDASEEIFVRWRVGRCLPYGESGPYGALAEIVKAQANVYETDDVATAREQLAASLSEILPASEVDRLTRLLGPLAGLPGRPVSPGEVDAAWRQILLALASHMPTVLVVEDLHFADPAMPRFLTELVKAASDVPLFVLCTYRPELLEDQPTWAAALPGKLTISLGPLRGAQQQELIRNLLVRHRLPERLTERLATIVAGNPLYAVEYVRMLAERAVDTEPELGVDMAIPETVHGVLANRIDLLDPESRTVLHAAAVLGDTVWSGAVCAMLDVEDATVEASLHVLQRRGILEASPVSLLIGTTELTFRNLLMRDVAYRRLPRAQRASLHRRAAVYFSDASVEGRHDLAAAVAHHRVAALELATKLGEETFEDTVSARRALTAAGVAAYAVYAVETALGHIEQALNHWPAGDDVVQRREAELLRLRLSFLADADRFYRDGGPKDIARLADVTRELGDRSGEARAETLLGQAELMRADRDRARSHLEAAVHIFDSLPDDPAKAEALAELSRLHMLEYEHARALPEARAAGDLAARLGLADLAANALVTQAMARYVGGDPAGVDDLERAVTLCRTRRLPALRRALANLATALQEEGELTRAAALEAESTAAQGAQVTLVVSHDEEAELAWFRGDWLTLMRAADDYLDGDGAETKEWDLQLRGRRACLRILRGEPTRGELSRCLETARRSGFNRLTFCALSYGAFGHALYGEFDRAAELLEEVARVWRPARTGLTLEWLSALGHAGALTAEVVPGAAALVGEVIETALNRNRWVEAAQALADGAAATARGERAAAAAHYTTAQERYDVIGGISDAVLAAVWAARARRAVGDKEGAEPYERRVRAFAERNRVPGLAALLTSLPSTG